MTYRRLDPLENFFFFAAALNILEKSIFLATEYKYKIRNEIL